MKNLITYLCLQIFLAMILSLTPLCSQEMNNSLNLKSSKLNSQMLWSDFRESEEFIIAHGIVFFYSGEELEKIEIIVNGKKDTSNVYHVESKEESKNIYSIKAFLPLSFEQNNYFLKIHTTNSKFFSDQLIVKNYECSVENNKLFTNKIDWIEPLEAYDKSNHFSSKYFHYSVIIRTSLKVDLEKYFEVVLNQSILKLKPTDEVLILGEGIYKITGYVILDPKAEYNMIYTRFKINDEYVNSKILRFNVINKSEDPYDLALSSFRSLLKESFSDRDVVNDNVDIANAFGENYFNSSAKQLMYLNSLYDMLRKSFDLKNEPTSSLYITVLSPLEYASAHILKLYVKSKNFSKASGKEKIKAITLYEDKNEDITLNFNSAKLMVPEFEYQIVLIFKDGRKLNSDWTTCSDTDLILGKQLINQHFNKNLNEAN